MVTNTKLNDLPYIRLTKFSRGGSELASPSWFIYTMSHLDPNCVPNCHLDPITFSLNEPIKCHSINEAFYYLQINADYYSIDLFPYLQMDSSFIICVKTLPKTIFLINLLVKLLPKR